MIRTYDFLLLIMISSGYVKHVCFLDFFLGSWVFGEWLVFWREDFQVSFGFLCLDDI